MAKYAVKIKERKTRILVSAKDAKNARKWTKRMGLTPVKVEKLHSFT